MTDVRCILYKQIISEGVIADIHGMKSQIYEIYIPKMKLFFNHTGIYSIHLGRYRDVEKLRMFYISFESASYLKQALEASKKANKLADELLRTKVEEFKGINQTVGRY